MHAEKRRLGRRSLHTAVVVLGAVGAAVLFVWNPAGNALFPKCAFFSTTGMHCPGCGTQRALHHLLHVRIVEAFHHNALALFCLPILVMGFRRWTLTVWSSRAASVRTPRPRRIWAFLVLVIAFWCLRNIPVYPLTLLAPPVVSQ